MAVIAFGHASLLNKVLKLITFTVLLYVQYKDKKGLNKTKLIFSTTLEDFYVPKYFKCYAAVLTETETFSSFSFFRDKQYNYLMLTLNIHMYFSYPISNVPIFHVSFLVSFSHHDSTQFIDRYESHCFRSLQIRKNELLFVIAL